MVHRKSRRKNRQAKNAKQEHSVTRVTLAPPQPAQLLLQPVPQPLPQPPLQPQPPQPQPLKEVYRNSVPQSRDPIIKKPLPEIDPERMKRAERYIEEQKGPEGNQKRRIIVHEFPGEGDQPTQIVVNKKPRMTQFGSASKTTQSTTPSKNLKNGKEDVESLSDISSDFYPSASYRQTKKLLSGFHPYYDEESDVMALQCSTCCIGSWRECSHRCTGCENFLSCPIYCWIGVWLPILLLLLLGFLISALYAGGLF